MITTEEKSQALAGAADFAEFVRRQPSVLKFVLRAIELLGPSNLHLRTYQRIEQIAKSTCEVDDSTAVAIWKDFVERTAQAEPVEEYTTSEVAKYFGVSTTTVNNWLAVNRFVGVNRSAPFKHARIPANTWWISATGKRIRLSDVIEMFEAESRTGPAPMTPEQELEQHRADIRRLEEKYGGPFHETLGTREPNTLQEERDAWEWRYLLRVTGQDAE